MDPKQKKPSKPDVLGIGAPVIDYIIEIDEEFLENVPGAKAGMVPVDHQTLKKLLSESKKDPMLFLGGSSANTIRGLANFGHHCAFIGKIGADLAGKKFLEEMSVLGISTSYILPSETPTAQVLCLITPDRERTMRAFLGASQMMSENDLHHNMFNDVRLVHIEGYLMLNKPVIQKAMEMAKEAGAKISFDLGSFEVVEKNRDKLVEYLSRYVDIVFANRDEIMTLTKLDPEKGCKVLRDICETVVVLLGKEGCIVGHGFEQKHYPAFPVHEPLDTTGAGDMFASGFLHGYLTGKSFEECAHYGALAGEAVVKVMGVDISPGEWLEIRKRMKL